MAEVSVHVIHRRLDAIAAAHEAAHRAAEAAATAHRVPNPEAVTPEGRPVPTERQHGH